MTKKITLISKLFIGLTNSEVEDRRQEWCDGYLRELEEYRFDWNNKVGHYCVYATCVEKEEEIND